MADCYIIDAARTPRGIGKAGKGALSHFHSGRLLAKVFEAIESRNDLCTEDVDDIVGVRVSREDHDACDRVHAAVVLEIVDKTAEGEDRHEEKRHVERHGAAPVVVTRLSR